MQREMGGGGGGVETERERVNNNIPPFHPTIQPIFSESVFPYMFVAACYKHASCAFAKRNIDQAHYFVDIARVVKTYIVPATESSRVLLPPSLRLPTIPGKRNQFR